MKIPYRFERGRILRPMVDVDILGENGVVIPTDALVDSGADVSLFDLQYAHAAGLTLYPQLIEHVDGVSGGLDVFPAMITVSVLGHRLRLKVQFADQIEPNLLGRDNFFHYFRVGFDELNHELELRYRRRRLE
jgi:predicted aspartyl protease